jgi:hypothetical protein
MLSEILLGVIAAAQTYQVGVIASRRWRAKRPTPNSTFERNDLAKVMGSSPLAQGRNGMP